MAALALLLAPWVLAAGPQEVVIAGEEPLLRFGDRGVTWVRGHAHLEAEGLWVDADHLLYDERQEAVTAVGHVVARVAQGSKAVFTGEVLALRLLQGEVREVYALEGRATLRTDVDAATLAAARTAEQAEKAGKIQALLEGNRFLHDGPRWTAERVQLTPCDCDFARPSWGISALQATVDSEAERVAVTSPVVKVKEVPVLWLPWLSLPLTERQTGLLFPKPGYGPLNGFTLDLPVFVTLGRSADLTLIPGLATGGTGTFGLAGPRLGAELRYTPARATSGRLFLGLVHDLRAPRDPLDPTLAGPGSRGLRGELSWSHLQELGAGFGARVDLNVHSDGYYFRDVTPDVIAATQGLLRSTASLFHRGPDSLVTLEAALRQDLGSGYNLLGETAIHPGSPAFGPGTLQRLPALSLQLPLHPLAGPLSGGLQADYVRLAPLFSLTGDEGQGAAEGSTTAAGQELSWACQADRLYGLGSSACATSLADRAGMGDRRWQPGEREARDRLQVVPRLQLSGAAFDAVALSAAAWWRQLAWAGEASGRLWQRGALVLDGRAETEAWRDLGTWRHVLTPLVALRAVPVVVEGGSAGAGARPVAYDEVDGALGGLGAGVWQGAVELRQRLVRRGTADGVRLDLGQGLWLPGGGQALAAGETYGRLQAQWWWLRTAAVARLDAGLGRFTRVQASLGLDDGRGHSVSLGYEDLLDDGTARTRAPLDLLFGLPVPAWAKDSRARLATGSAAWSFGVVSLRYEILLLTSAAAPATGGAPRPLGLAQHALTVGVTPACDCWRVDLTALERTDGKGTLLVPEFGFSLTVARFGSIGTR